MRIEYILRQIDYLQLSLYLIKKDKFLRKYIIKESIIWFVIVLVIGLILLFNGNADFSILVFVGGIIGLVIRPKRVKNLYYKRLLKQTEIYKDKFNVKNKLVLGDDHLELYAKSGEHKINLSAVEAIIETENHFFIKLKPEVIIIPKVELESYSSVRNELIGLSNKLKRKYESELNWKW